MRTAVTSLLALSIVAFTGIALIGPLTVGTMEGIQLAQGIMALLGPIVGTVIGYYFGTASGERVAEQANLTAAQAVERRAEIEQVSDDALSTVDDEIREVRQLLVDLLAAQGQEPGGDSDAEGDESDPESVP